MKKLSIISTLAEAVLLGARYWVLLLVLSLIVGIPPSLIDAAGSDASYRHDPGLALFRLSIQLIAIILISVKHAAILGVLKRSGEAPLFGAAIAGAEAWTWTLFRVSILLAGITLAVLLPFGLLIVLMAKVGTSGARLLVPVVLVIYVIFIKYSLADPVVAIEHLGARAALSRSWDLTMGHFWYVLGCYICLGAGGYAFDSLLKQFASVLPLHYPQLIVSTLSSYFASLWLLTAWCMYWRIKDAESYDPSPPSVDVLPPIHPD